MTTTQKMVKYPNPYRDYLGTLIINLQFAAMRLTEAMIDESKEIKIEKVFSKDEVVVFERTLTDLARLIPYTR